MEAIKQLGTNAEFPQRELGDDLREPDRLTNFLSIYLLLSIPVALTYTFGKMVGSIKHGFALLAVIIPLRSWWPSRRLPSTRNPAVAAAGIHSTVGNTEGKEVRFGDTSTALFGSPPRRPRRIGRRVLRLLHAIGGFGLLTGMMMAKSHGGTVPVCTPCFSTRSSRSSSVDS